VAGSERWATCSSPACGGVASALRLELTTSYSPAENGPEGFYARLGFRPTGGELHHGQRVAERILKADG
jgi:hypothetical protein